jgi:predicted membrane-bound mannosyltransferase/DNA-binding beta-propeller fold protein YncE
MTVSHDDSITKKINSLLITSLALIIFGGALIILGASLEGPAYDRWGLTGTRIAGFVALVGLILMLVSPILTIVRYKWLVEVSQSIVADRSIAINPVTKYLVIASFSVGYLLGIFFVYLPFRNGFSSGLWVLLIPGLPLSLHAEFIRRTLMAAIQIRNKPLAVIEEQNAEQHNISVPASAKAEPVKTTETIREKKAPLKAESSHEQKHGWLNQPIHPALPAITNEVALFILVMLAAVVTRFFNLEARVMSHDESLHTYFSYLLYKNGTYQHTPMMHGPFQFHLLALIYYLFGVSDFTARIPSVLFSIATIWMVWYWRRYLGRAGALIAGVLLVISPYMLYYGRYVRNESFVGLSGILMLYAMLRYLETGSRKQLYLLSAALVLHFTAKETAFIYAAQALLYLAIYFIARVTRRPWAGNENLYRAFIVLLAIGILLGGTAAGIGLTSTKTATITATETAAPANPDQSASPFAPPESGLSAMTVLIIVSVLFFLAAAAVLLIGYTWTRLTSERSFDLLIVLGTLVLPNLTAFAIKFTEKWHHTAIPTSEAEVQALSSNPTGLWVIGIALAIMFGISIVVGMLWNKEIWWKVALIFWAPFTILYTTVFTNSAGFFTGVLGSLGYWLVQQGVERGSQPWYFYLLIQIPIYEFLPALGLILAIFLGLRRRIRKTEEPEEVTEGILLIEPLEPAEESPVVAPSVPQEIVVAEPLTSEESNFTNTFSLLVWWSITSIAAFSYAGEKMPWLTYHMTLPMILITGWALGHVVDALDWDELRRRHVWIVLALAAVFATSLTMSLLAILGPTPPFGGKDLDSLQATGNFLLPAIAAVVSAGGLLYLLIGWSVKQIFRTFVLTVFTLLAVLTMRAAFRASYITYDQATEYLVYAHGASGIKQVMAQAKEISQRTTGGMGLALAYDASAPDTGVSWPFVWYLRDYSNQRSFDIPTRSLRDSDFVIVDQKNFDKIEAALGPGYYRFDYIRMWWPNQDYFGLTCKPPAVPEIGSGFKNRLRTLYDRTFTFFEFKKWDCERIANAIKDPNIRAGIWDIWFNRDYSRYAQAVAPYNSYFDPNIYTLTGWSPADQMRLYIKKDLAAKIWNYGVAPVQTVEEVDPYAANTITLSADLIIDANSLQTTALNAPRGLAFAPDGTFYVADSRNHRILHLSTDGKLLGEWGTFGDGVNTPNPIGTFNEPWGVAVGPDGTVYVSDTWNHRIQHFTASGKPLGMWGSYGQGETPEAFWGPRGVAVDAQGKVYVADTGNKRIVVFDAQGGYITQFGSAGLDPGQFDEPVGVAVAADGTVYVTDTWNQRIQAFTHTVDGLYFVPTLQWDVSAWFGQSLENKPLIAINAAGHIFVTDPEAFRILEFDASGKFIRTWGDYGVGPSEIGLAGGVAVDAEGRVWVADAGNQRIMRFVLP